eukprot:Plantae.Rhodophyta-Hildenbrandia_rubra.ctg2883.p1 GENE.Plantae.Rhodophyta-Hildenbrandia_rubra.ctg2883~~Plantae.Rhodophyta-Hildenbrandia_rubra.ctg2883.p1  ORF type:complete len:947 (+),score=228.93 Plantae.Rhodophyta-Hildenbrandia_rubra.ctg2883:180-3020(+)
MSSRFFATGDSSSESDTESASSSDEEQEIVTEPAVRPGIFSMESDSDDEIQRQVKSASLKQKEALTSIVGNMRNHMKNNDWTKIQEDFDELNDALKKIRKKDVVTGVFPPVPELYLRAIVTLEIFLAETLKDRPKLSKFNNQSLNKMKLRVPKNSKLYAKELAKLKDTGKPTLDDMPESGSEEDSDESEESDSDSEIDGQPAHSKWLLKGDSGKKKEERVKKVKRSQSRSAAEGRSDDTGLQGGEDMDGFTMVTKKKTIPIINPEDMTESLVDQKLAELLGLRGRRGTNRYDQMVHLESLLKAAKTDKQSLNLTLHLISAQFDCIPASKPAMPRGLWLKALENTKAVVKLAATLYPDIRFADETDNLEDLEDMPAEKTAATENGVENEEESKMGNQSGDTADKDRNNPGIGADGSQLVQGDLASIFERLDDELHQAYQSTDAYSPQYVTLLCDETPLLELAALIQKYYEDIADDETTKADRSAVLLARAARIATRRIRHQYYKTEALRANVKELRKTKAKTNKENDDAMNGGMAAGGSAEEGSAVDEKAAGFAVDNNIASSGEKSESPEENDLEDPEDASLRSLAVLVYRYGTDRAKSEVILCQIFNQALEGRFYQGRDMLLMSHLQDSISSYDVALQVMFNRAMTQLGLCAFRKGLLWETHACLQELCSPSFTGGGGPGRVKELLAQGVISSRGYEKTPEMEKAERRRQIPYHMHIPLELIEAAHLTSAMLLEVPAMALSRSRGEVRRRALSKSFQYFLRNSMKQAFPGPPENTRDHVMSATRCLMKGDWAGTYQHISAMRCWKSLEGSERRATLAKIEERIKTEALRTFALSYSAYYESLGIEELSKMFDFGKDRIHSVISKMIMNGELAARWDQPTGCAVMRKVEPSRLQSLASGLSGKLGNIADMNERLAEAKAGGSDDKKDWKQERGRGGRREGRSDRRRY